MSSSKIGYQVAASMDKILNTKVLSKFAKSTKEKECDCKKDCNCDCKVEKKISKKADAVLYLIKSSETLDKLGLHKIASDLLISAAGLLDDPEKDRMQKENEIISKMESEKDPQLFRDLAEAEIRSKLLSKDEEKDEESFNLEPSVIEALEKTEMFSDEELAQLKKLHEESNEDESLSWDVDDGDLVDNLDLDTSMAWDDESDFRKDSVESLLDKIRFSSENNIFDPKYDSSKAPKSTLSIDTLSLDEAKYVLDKLFEEVEFNQRLIKPILTIIKYHNDVISKEEYLDKVDKISNPYLKSLLRFKGEELFDLLEDASMAWDDEFWEEGKSAPKVETPKKTLSLKSHLDEEESDEEDLEFEEGELEEDDYLQDSLLDNKFLSDKDDEEDEDLDKQFHKKFKLSKEDEDLEDEDLDEDLDEELDDLYNQFSSRQTDYDDEVSDELSEEDEEDFDL